ncbi:FAD-binding oxidoreductase [Actinomadura verrucosospora]|uniref:FAD linked oxidase domain-containing protein n=1 Tax=Actinomadura verrucosospora TaxID=46165 RepID=A0A7D3VYC6_ACTVE|nr:FAD-binding protein [Actinomadura verrucosospora]QKG23994.1 FAD linked oxidase domain-containing protein [Actinomadura verrucosospora]
MSGSDLRRAVKGRVLEPGDDGFDEARKAWNLTVDQPVSAVVEAADAEDVAALVRYARRSGRTVTAQAAGHDASGDVDGVILLRTGRLDGLRIRDRLARVGAGVNWGRVQAAAGPEGLTGLAGSSPVVNVTGYTLGGGLSWFGRKYGWAADSVRAFDVVDAEGDQARVTASSDPELFWGLKGGGGDFALVTALEFDLHPACTVYGGRVVWPAERAGEVFETFRKLTGEAPPELTVWFNRFAFPGAPPMVALDLTYLGDPSEGAALVRAIDAIDGPIGDDRGLVAVADLGGIAGEPTRPTASLPRAELLTGLDESLVTEPIEPLISIQIRHLSGALAEPGTGASGALPEPYLLQMVGGGPDPARVRAKQVALVERFRAVIAGRKPYTLLTPGETAADAFPAATLARLRDLKRSRDPHGVFRANHPVLT